MKYFKIIFYVMSVILFFTVQNSAKADFDIGPIQHAVCDGLAPGDSCSFGALAPELSFLTGYKCYPIESSPETCGSNDCACWPGDFLTACDGSTADSICTTSGETAPKICDPVGGNPGPNCDSTNSLFCACVSAEHACPWYFEFLSERDPSKTMFCDASGSEDGYSIECTQQSTNCENFKTSADNILGYNYVNVTGTENVLFSSDAERFQECVFSLLGGENACSGGSPPEKELCGIPGDNDCDGLDDVDDPDCQAGPLPECSDEEPDPVTDGACSENIGAATVLNQGEKNALEQICKNIVKAV